MVAAKVNQKLDIQRERELNEKKRKEIMNEMLSHGEDQITPRLGRAENPKQLVEDWLKKEVHGRSQNFEYVLTVIANVRPTLMEKGNEYLKKAAETTDEGQKTVYEGIAHMFRALDEELLNLEAELNKKMQQ